MGLLNNKKGKAIIYVGGPLVFLILIVVFIIIAQKDPKTAAQITENLANLSKAAQGITP